MPYFVAVYDVGQKRVGKMLKLFRRYLVWVQNSVFEGELTEAQFRLLQLDAEKILQEGDSIVFYRLRDERYTERVVLGADKGHRSRFL
jgi:CRISPR-associated protein Cas2